MDKLREKVRNLLNEGKVAGYIGYINAEGNHPLPHFFTKERLAEVDHLGAALGGVALRLEVRSRRLLLRVVRRDLTVWP